MTLNPDLHSKSVNLHSEYGNLHSKSGLAHGLARGLAHGLAHGPYRSVLIRADPYLMIIAMGHRLGHRLGHRWNSLELLGTPWYSLASWGLSGVTSRNATKERAVLADFKSAVRRLRWRPGAF